MYEFTLPYQLGERVELFLRTSRFHYAEFGWHRFKRKIYLTLFSLADVRRIETWLGQSLSAKELH